MKCYGAVEMGVHRFRHPGHDQTEGCLFVQDYAQERSVDLKSAVVLDEAQFPEFVHEKIDA
jgi:hypothetical protein